MAKELIPYAGKETPRAFKPAITIRYDSLEARMLLVDLERLTDRIERLKLQRQRLRYRLIRLQWK